MPAPLSLALALVFTSPHEDALSAPPAGEIRCLHDGRPYREGDTYTMEMRDGRVIEFVCAEYYERRGAAYVRLPRWFPLGRMGPDG